jgi:ATP synthase protein I
LENVRHGITAKRDIIHYFNDISRKHQILTCPDTVSMVRAAFKGERGVISINTSIVSGLHTMADDARDGGDHKDGSRVQMTPEEAALSARLGNLDRRLSEIQDNRKIQTDLSGTETTAHAKASAMAVGLRLSSELVAGILAGAALGWGFDRLLSTSPWGFIVFLLLGFVGGVVNVMRTAGVMAKQSDRL